MDLHRPVNKQILTLTAEERIDTTQDMQEIADKLTQTVKEWTSLEHLMHD